MKGGKEGKEVTSVELTHWMWELRKKDDAKMTHFKPAWQGKHVKLEVLTEALSYER